MSSVLRSVRKRKKGRTLGAVDVIDLPPRVEPVLMRELGS